jgi:hypothetical protein
VLYDHVGLLVSLGDATIRAASHYGHPSREAVGLNGQTLLNLQRVGLKTTNKIKEM